MKKQWMLVAATIISSPLLAQQDSTKTKSLEEVIVTANKFEQKQNSTGKVITVIGKEVIEKSGGKTVAQLLNEQAGVVINGALNNAGSVQTLYVRGAGPGRTLILMDGIPMNDPSFINNEYDLNFFSINDVERIEICKGAQSTLYGSDAIAGVINIITVKKDINKPINVKATTSFGNKNTTRNNVQVYGKCKKLTYTARFGQLKTNGFSSAYDSTNKKNFDNDAYNGNVASAAFQYQFTPALSVKTFIQHSQYKSDIDAAAFTDKRNYFIKNKALQTGVGFVYNKNKWQVTGNFQYSQLTRHYDDNASINAASFSTNDYRGFGKFAELYSTYKINEHLTVLAGADYKYANMDGRYFSSSYGESKYKDTSMHQTSLYGSVIYTAFTNKLNIELGGRWNNHSRYGSNSTFTFNPSYAITDKLRVFGSIATGFKSPSLYQLYDTYSGNKDLQPEKSTNYEAGVQYTTGKINTRAVYFNRKINNGIDYNYISYQYFNYIKQNVSGLELELTVKPIETLSITANYTLLTAQETTQNRVTNKDTVTYDYLLRRPKSNINLNIGWQATKALYLSVSTKYVSKRYDIGGYKKPDVQLNSYCLLNAYVAYKLNEHINFFADAQNIGNKKFFDIRGFNAIPFLCSGGITFNW